MFNFVDIFALMIALNRIPFDKQLIWLFILHPLVVWMAKSHNSLEISNLYHSPDRISGDTMSLKQWWCQFTLLGILYTHRERATLAREHQTWIELSHSLHLVVHMFTLKPFRLNCCDCYYLTSKVEANKHKWDNKQAKSQRLRERESEIKPK